MRRDFKTGRVVLFTLNDTKVKTHGSTENVKKTAVT